MQNINIIAPLNQLGYGQAGQNVSLALAEGGATVALFPIYPPQPGDIPEDKVELFDRLKANAGEYDMNAPCIRIWHQDQMGEFVGRGPHIGFPFFELNRFNARERHHLDALDKIFVASKWAKEIVLSQIPNQDVRVVPLGVDRTIFNECVHADNLEPDYTKFVNIGKWEIRKGHDFLLEAFCKAFTPADKVKLDLVPYNPFIGARNDEWARKYLGSAMGRNIKLWPKLTDQKALSRLVMAGADVGIFPARAEGWNLELLELMSMGKHVITTHVSAHTEFATTDNARLIYVSEKETAEDGVWFHGQGEWASLGADQLEQCIVHMREVHRLKQTGQLGVNSKGIETAIKYSWLNTAETILGNL